MWLIIILINVNQLLRSVESELILKHIPFPFAFVRNHQFKFITYKTLEKTKKKTKQ